MVNNQNIAVLSEKVAALEAAIKNAGIELPEVTGADNGKGLQVVNGAWATGAIIPDSVTANPTGEIANNLTALQIGSIKYNVGSAVETDTYDNTALTGCRIVATKRNGVISLNVSTQSDTTSGVETELMTLPSKYWPSTTFTLPLTGTSNNYCRVGNNGKVYISTNNGYSSGIATYI